MVKAYSDMTEDGTIIVAAMVRLLDFVASDLPQHVILRGGRWQQTSFDDDDEQLSKDLLV